MDQSKALGVLYLTCGSTAAMNFAPSTPILLSRMLRSVSGALKTQQRAEIDELEGEEYIIRKRAASCILPRKRPRDCLCALNADLVVLKIQRFQRGLEKPNA